MRKLFQILFLILIPALAFGATAAPTVISTATVVGSTVTVNSTAHGLSSALPSGFCISGSSTGSLNVCGVVATATANSFTFTLTGATACASSCGNVVASKRVVWLTTQTVAGGYSVNYLLWITTTSPVGGKNSAWTGASAAENAATSSGVFIEVNRTEFFPSGTTLANAQAFMVNDWVTQQSTQTASVQPGAFLGDFYDGTGWLN